MRYLLDSRSRITNVSVKITKPNASKLSDRLRMYSQVSSHFLSVVAVFAVAIASVNISLLDTYRVLTDVTLWKESSSR